jgi:nucleoside-diphosphate-sugar epimerase
MRILVTGATGFIGLPLTRHLVGQEHEILALSRSPLRSENSINWLSADLSFPETYQDAIRSFEPEILIHLAWQDIPDFSFENSENNLNQSLDFFSYIISLGCCKKIIVSGSCFEFNQLNGECLESDKGTPKDNFTWAKHSLRLWLEVECKKEDIKLGWMRIFYVYGPRQRSGSLIPSILNNLQDGKLPHIRAPKNFNDFVFVDDVIEAFSNAISMQYPSGIYNLGSGISTSILEVCRKAEMIVMGSDILSQKLNEETVDTSANIDFWASCIRAEKYLNWQPIIGLEEGIIKTWQWQKNL